MPVPLGFSPSRAEYQDAKPDPMVLGRIVPEMRDASIRELFVFSYRVIYRVEGEVATVVAVVHGKRLLETEN